MTERFPRGRARLLAFDLDGTLVDSAPDLNHCLGEALEAVGLPRPTELETRSWIGDGVEELIRRGLAHAVPGSTPESFRSGAEAEAFRAAFSTFSSCYAQSLFERSTLYPAVPETLDALRSHRFRLCCITNKRIGFASGLLELARIADRFDLVLGGDSLPDKKPSPMQLVAAAEHFGADASEAVLVGDSRNDFRAARGARWAFVWAKYGYCTVLDDAAYEPMAEIGAFAELVELLVPATGSAPS